MTARTKAPSKPPDTIAPATDTSARGRLMQSAVEIFGRKGYSATSVREIIEQAGVTKPVLYYHFGSKEGLMMAIIEEAARAVSGVVERAKGQGGSTRERVFRLFAALRELVRTRTSELRVVHAVYYFAPELLPSFDYRVFERIILGEFERIIRDGIESGELRPASPLHAAVALGAVLGAVFDQELIRHDIVLKETDVFQVLTVIFDGLCPTP